MDDFVFVDTSFDKNKTKEYILSIQVSLDGFSFSIVDGDKKCLALNRFIPFHKSGDSNPLDSFIEIVRNNSFLNSKFNNVSIIWISKRVMLIPSEFFTDEFAFDSFQLSHQLDQTDCILWNELTSLKSHIVFSFPESIKEFIQTHFENPSFYHHTYPFFHQAIKAKSIESHPQVFVNIQDDFFNVIIPEKNGKHFINTFSYQTDSDLTYFILNIFKQQKLNNERSKLILDGKIEQDSKIVNLLKKYLGKVEVKMLPSHYKVSNKLTHKEYNQYINLLNLSMCE